MRKRKLRWTVALAGLALLTAVVVATRPCVDRITRQKFDRIQDGMGRKEVEAILGPPGDYTTGLLDWGDGNIVDCSILPPIGDTPELVIRFWATDTAFAVVAFDGNGRVKDAEIKPCAPAQVGYLDNLIWRAKREWRKSFP